ncbi:cupin domain-containing protein [Akkermansia glycaniphila]|uniref:cupin domain-containing protein n=1 Tax=Akkermansia glycaniphila TaxID=1679444 RepID=UPI001C014465|nr:cupin domain-containing protein [Akkermansia glycaniphila]MBT9450029.1 cupin domain-containing protein [Akkermansia glycaniphila]
MSVLQHIEQGAVVRCGDLVGYQDNQIVSMTLARTPHVNISLFAFDAGEELSEHTSTGDAMVDVLEGKATVFIQGEPHVVQSGESIVLPAHVPHAVQAVERFKMRLTVLFG